MLEKKEGLFAEASESFVQAPESEGEVNEPEEPVEDWTGPEVAI